MQPCSFNMGVSAGVAPSLQFLKKNFLYMISFLIIILVVSLVAVFEQIICDLQCI